MQRATYSPVDLAHLLRNKVELEIEDEATRYLDRLDTNGDGLVQAEEMGEFCTQDLDVKLQDAELDALHDLLDNSFDHTRVRDVCAFFESRDAVAGPGPSRLSVPRSNTVTTLAFSPDASRVGCGGIDSVLVVYDLSERVERRLLERRLPNMVGAISLGVRGVASGCFGGRVDFVEDVLKAAPPPGEDPGEPPHAFSTSPKGCKASSATWELGQNVNAIALNESDGEVAVAAECELTIFSLATKEPKFVFPADGILWAVSMARSIVHVIELDGGASLRVTAKCVEEHGTTHESPSKLFVRSFSTKNVDEETRLRPSSDRPSTPRGLGDLAELESLHRSPASASTAASSTTALVQGCTLRISKIKTTRVADILLVQLESVPVLCVMLTLVLISVLLSSLTVAKVRIDARAASRVDTWITCLFVVEHLRTFFGDPFCVVDFIVVLIDVVLLAGAVGSNLSGAEGFAKAVRLVRLVRLVRVVRAGRIIRKMASSDYRGKLRYDVELPGGDVVRDVDREDVWTEAEDAYARLRDAAPGDGLPTPAKSLRAPRKPLRRISNKTGAPFGERDRMPCTFRVRGIADMRRETLKLMMMGGEAQQAVLWSYDLNATEVAPGTPDVVRSVVEENGTRVVRFARRELTMPFEQTVNGVAISGGGTRVAACDSRGKVVVFDLFERCAVFQEVDGDLLYSCALSHSGDEILFAGASMRVTLCDVNTGATLYGEVADDRVRCVALGRAGYKVAFGGFDAKFHVRHTRVGAHCHVAEGSKMVRSVSLDREGTILAVGGDDCATRCFKLEGDHPLGAPAWVALHKSKVWIVRCAPSGEAVAAGDYSNGVCVYRAADGAILWQKTTWRGRGAPFTWALSWAGDGSRLAIGHWDAYAYVVDANTYRETHHARRGDRVYSVALSSDGGGLLVGGRDKRVALYAVAGAGGDLGDPAHAWLLDAFVYAVAASHDDRHVAVGCVNCQVVVFAARAPYARLSTISQEGLVQFIEFSPCAPSLLAVASEQPCVWADVGAAAPRLALALRRHTSTHGVSLSRHGLAYCSGTLFSTYGTGTNAPSYADRPSYEMAQAALDHDRALGAILCAHPSVVNARGFSGETLLQYAVRKKSAAVVERLLGARCVVGAALGDGNGMNALAVALRNERRTVVRRLLDSIQASAAQFPLGGTATTSALGELAEKYPDILVAFLTDLTMIQDHALAPMGRNIALLPSSTNLITAGSSERSPAKFWDPLLRKSERSERSTGARKKAARVSSIQQTDQAFGMTSPTGKAPAAPERQPTMMRKRWSGISQKALDATRVNLFVTQRSRFSLPGFAQDAHPATSALETPGNEAWRLMIADRADRYREGFAFADLKKTEVAALRAPFESICGTFARGMPEPDSFLAIVARASAQQGVYRAYNSVLVQSIIQFKWDAFAKAIFLSQFALCVLHLSVVCGLYFAVFDDAGRGRTTIRNPAGGSPRGVGELLTLVFAALLSLGFLCIELSQILIEGQREYFGGGAHSAWKALDLFCYALQLVVDGVLAFDVGALDVLSVFCCLNLLAFTFKIISFARVFDDLGALVRMIVKIGYEIRHFMIVVSILLLGFWVSFSLLYNQPPTFDQAIDLIDSGLASCSPSRCCC
ncbi:Rho guanyl-nucleotide exchange factor [Aureococcus anophagefferens]|uniref:Rho guanyl-nucleotide exchange factor n=1 Tax=Aureococcus anophagefferens TaxID=44056 RepID=A0ABR1FKJ7_AURAN